MNRALYIGRFNPPHLGHLSSIKYILNKENDIDQVIIGIGSAQESFTTENPFTSGERFEMLLASLNEFEIQENKYLIVPIPDLNNNNQWMSYLKSILPSFKIIYSNNPLVSLLTKNDNELEIRNIPFINREKWSSTNIRRKIILNDESWIDLVPKSVRKFILQLNGLERIRLLNTTDQ